MTDHQAKLRSLVRILRAENLEISAYIDEMYDNLGANDVLFELMDERSRINIQRNVILQEAYDKELMCVVS